MKMQVTIRWRSDHRSITLGDGPHDPSIGY